MNLNKDVTILTNQVQMEMDGNYWYWGRSKALGPFEDTLKTALVCWTDPPVVNKVSHSSKCLK